MNAVFEKDFVAFSTSPRFQWMRFGVACAMGLTLLVLVLPAYAKGNFSNIGAVIFTASVTIGMGLVIVAVPGSFATVLVHARAGSTLPVLLTTPLTTLSIASGAFIARACAFFALLVATWPPIASSLLFGGVRGSQLFAATATIAATGLLVAAPAYLASAFARRTSTAVVVAYLAAVTSLATLKVIGDRLAAAGGGAWDPATISPAHAAVASFAVSGAALDAPYVLLAWTAALSVAVVVAVAWRLSREGRGTADESRIASVGRRSCRTLRHENPVLDRETRLGGPFRSGSGRGLFLLLVASEAVFAVLAWRWYEPTYLPLHFGVLAMQTLLIVLSVTASGATALAAEREGRTLDLVRMTPLTPREIVVGKLYGLGYMFWPCLVVPLVHLAIAAYLGVFSPVAVVFTAVTGAVAMSAWAVFALSQSLDQANPNRAVMRTMGAFGLVAVLLAANVGFPVHGLFSHTEDWVRRTAAFAGNPVALMLLPAAALRNGGSDDTNKLVPPPQEGDLTLALFLGLGWIALHVALGFAVYRTLFHMYKTRVDG